jgi:hypothetical protein
MNKIVVWVYYTVTSIYMCTRENPATYFLFFLAQYGLIFYLAFNSLKKQPDSKSAYKSLMVYAGLLFIYNVLLINEDMPTFCKYAKSQVGGILFSLLAFILIVITFLNDDKTDYT